MARRKECHAKGGRGGSSVLPTGPAKPGLSVLRVKLCTLKRVQEVAASLSELAIEGVGFATLQVSVLDYELILFPQ